MVYADLWLSEQDAGRDDAGQECEDYGRVRARGGAHLRAQGGEKRARGLESGILDQRTTCYGEAFNFARQLATPAKFRTSLW